jgi:hypothetical protein
MKKVPNNMLAENNIVAAMDIDKSNSGYLLSLNNRNLLTIKELLR